jgi:hypothetical protein
MLQKMLAVHIKRMTSWKEALKVIHDVTVLSFCDWSREFK